jgi:hypothetical protein
VAKILLPACPVYFCKNIMPGCLVYFFKKDKNIAAKIYFRETFLPIYLVYLGKHIAARASDLSIFKDC